MNLNFEEMYCIRTEDRDYSEFLQILIIYTQDRYCCHSSFSRVSSEMNSTVNISNISVIFNTFIWTNVNQEQLWTFKVNYKCRKHLWCLRNDKTSLGSFKNKLMKHFFKNFLIQFNKIIFKYFAIGNWISKL